jgi:hypothetical protein
MKTNDVLKAIAEGNTITEQQINLLKNRMNRGEVIDIQFIWDGEIELTPEQNKKGIEFLLNLWRTPKGIERKNNPFGRREQRVLETFKTFYFHGFYDNSRYGQRAYYIPLYTCVGSDGCFEYYYNGECNIIG